MSVEVLKDIDPEITGNRDLLCLPINRKKVIVAEMNDITIAKNDFKAQLLLRDEMIKKLSQDINRLENKLASLSQMPIEIEKSIEGIFEEQAEELRDVYIAMSEDVQEKQKVSNEASGKLAKMIEQTNHSIDSISFLIKKCEDLLKTNEEFVQETKMYMENHVKEIREVYSTLTDDIQRRQKASDESAIELSKVIEEGNRSIDSINSLINNCDDILSKNKNFVCETKTYIENLLNDVNKLMAYT